MEVTSRLEAMLARIKGIKEISSTSGNGWGRITLELDKHTNIDAARFEANVAGPSGRIKLSDFRDEPSGRQGITPVHELYLERFRYPDIHPAIRRGSDKAPA